MLSLQVNLGGNVSLGGGGVGSEMMMVEGSVEGVGGGGRGGTGAPPGGAAGGPVRAGVTQRPSTHDYTTNCEWKFAIQFL